MLYIAGTAIIVTAMQVNFDSHRSLKNRYGQASKYDPYLTFSIPLPCAYMR